LGTIHQGAQAYDIIAQRVLKIVTTKTTEVTISIERPFPDVQDFKCRYKIECPEGTQQGYSMGIDAIQALTLPLHRLAVDINFSG